MPRTTPGVPVKGTINAGVHQRLRYMIGPGRPYKDWSHAIEYALAHLETHKRLQQENQELKITIAELQGELKAWKRIKGGGQTGD